MACCRYRHGLFSSSAAAAMLAHAAEIFTSRAKSSLCLIGYVAFLGVICDQNRIVQADCWYDNQRHTENSEVPTGEPCLNCTCNRSVLLCYLRICPNLPNPPPPGCILLHKYRTCCPELICSDFYDGGNSLEARSDPEGGLDIPSDDLSAYENACISNGSIYAPGSAMHTSSLCEYCYCLTGKQVCVKPKCLLPIEGCIPLFEDTSCCPVRYNCTSVLGETNTEDTTTTVISTSTAALIKDGCLVDGTHYPEGSKVIGVGHSVCDNCYCLRGLLRCEPLSCAPPLLGCTPVVKPGDCCAASYNCNGTLEIEPEPNYGLFPTISKEYSKLRKEVHRKTPIKHSKDGVVTVAPFYVLAETLQDPTTKFVYQRSPDTYGTTRQFSGVYLGPSSTKKPSQEASGTPKDTSEDNFYLISSSKQKTTTNKPVIKHRTVPGVYYATTNYEFQNKNYKRVYSTTFRSHERSLPTKVRPSSSTSSLETKEALVDSSDYFGLVNLNILSIVDSLLDGKLYRKLDNESETEQELENKVLNTTTERSNIAVKEYLNQSTATNTFTTTDSIIDTANTTIETITDETTFFMESTTVTENDVQSTTTIEQFDSTATTDDQMIPITVRTVLKSTDCINSEEQILEKDNQNIEVTTIIPIDPGEVNGLAETRTEFLTTTDFDIEGSSLENSLTEKTVSLDVKSRNKASIGVLKLSPDIEAILNITHHKNGDDFDYDYNEPTLPPSLPNLKIIPFVAADALDSKKKAPKDPTPVFIDKKMDEEPFEYNTNLFSPPVKTEGGFVPKESLILDTFYENVASVPSLTNEPSGSNNVDCISDGLEVKHGMSVPSETPCMTCTCFYGNIVCQKPNCPPPRPGCKKAFDQGVTLCCPNYVCGEPGLPLLDRQNVPQEIVTVAEGIIPSDPFKDVIRTEPAPNLQSLIGDMRPFQRITSTTGLPPQAPATKESEKVETTTLNPENTFGLDEIFKFIFSGGSSDNSGKNPNKKPANNKNVPTENISGSEGAAPGNNSEKSVNSLESINNSSAKNPVATSTTTSVEIDGKNNDNYVKLNILTNTSKRKTTNSKFSESANNLQTNILSLSKSTSNKIDNKDDKNKETNNKDTNIKKTSNVGVGLLKLAGCNIYGRMYRVGRIISELSGPCLECKCTDVGVQCRPLKC